jgi:hypothetical protein
MSLSNANADNNTNAGAVAVAAAARNDRWKVNSLLMEVIDDIDAEPRTTTLTCIAKFIGHRSGARGRKGRRIYFANFVENNPLYRRTVLYPAFRKACLPEGFLAAPNGYQLKDLCVRIGCSRCRLYADGNASKKASAPVKQGTREANKKSRKRKTWRPLSKEDRCTFQFPIYWDEGRKLWYIWEYNAGCRRHRGHRRLTAEEAAGSRTGFADMALFPPRAEAVAAAAVEAVAAAIAAAPAANEAEEKASSEGGDIEASAHDDGEGDAVIDTDDASFGPPGGDNEEDVQHGHPTDDSRFCNRYPRHGTGQSYGGSFAAASSPGPAAALVPVPDPPPEVLAAIRTAVIWPGTQYQHLHPLLLELCGACRDERTYYRCVMGLQNLRNELAGFGRSNSTRSQHNANSHYPAAGGGIHAAGRSAELHERQTLY